MPRKTTIFLASSSELKAERAALETRIGRRNKLWVDDGIFLELVIWEDFVDAMSTTRLQDEYDAAIRTADIFVLLVHTKVGKYSAEEFETAHRQFMATKRPRIYTYFKNPVALGDPEPGPDYGTVRALQAQLAGLGHFYTPYTNIEGLVDHFTQQLDKLRAQGFIEAEPPARAAAGTPAFQATAGPDAAVAQGAGAVAVGRGGVYVGGRNSGTIVTGTQTNVHTGGGAYVGGSVNLHGGGQFVGRDMVAGRDAASTADLPALFATVMQVARDHAEPGQAPLAEEQAQALQEEAAKPAAQRDDGRMARLVDGLVDLVPGAVGAVVSAFASPLLGGVAGPATEAVLKRLRQP